MGGKKRKASSGPVKKESKYKIPRRFDCPICDAKASIAVKVLNREGHKEALIKCRNCGVGAQDPPRAMLPLEKAVDAFFDFREELMEKDRAYLESRGLDIGVITAVAAPQGPHSASPENGNAATTRAADAALHSGSGAVMYPSGGGLVRNLAELEQRVNADHHRSAAHVAGAGGSKGRPSTLAAATVRGHYYDDNDDDVAATAAQHFAPRRDAESEDDEYEAMFS